MLLLIPNQPFALTFITYDLVLRILNTHYSTHASHIVKITLKKRVRKKKTIILIWMGKNRYNNHFMVRGPPVKTALLQLTKLYLMYIVDQNWFQKVAHPHTHTPSPFTD